MNNFRDKIKEFDKLLFDKLSDDEKDALDAITFMVDRQCEFDEKLLKPDVFILEEQWFAKWNRETNEQY